MIPFVMAALQGIGVVHRALVNGSLPAMKMALYANIPSALHARSFTASLMTQPQYSSPPFGAEGKQLLEILSRSVVSGWIRRTSRSPRRDCSCRIRKARPEPRA